ncbi:hypothetical protein M378DRAFT_155479 [Amanita muscaria Koide BX008]|uniref:Uncharacterized protein n=1 Tax=Amanita muscaria (strain Koide BX008) TaxID=946122 RepID=A0A0C2TTD5_AMAMK|nr:hypothetical protein M378DRAFT_155479 [Amanita muscaria Koide BX008]
MLHPSPVVSKSLTDKVTEAADKVNKKMGKGLASAIEVGEKATQSAKESMGSMAEDTKSKAEHMTKEAKHKADKLSHETHQAKEDELRK